MRSVLILCLALLVGCTAPPPPSPERPVLRDPTANFASQVDVTAQDLDGVWVVRQTAGPIWTLGSRYLFSVNENQLLLTQSPPLPDDWDPLTGSLPFTLTTFFDPIGPGRWAGTAFANAPPDMVFWVLWMDFDRRTVALGDPDGTFVAILDRSETGGEDRIAAAREILDWFGYDLTQLQTR